MYNVLHSRASSCFAGAQLSCRRRLYDRYSNTGRYIRMLASAAGAALGMSLCALDL